MAKKKSLWTDEDFAEFKKGFIQSAENLSENIENFNVAPATSGVLHTDVQEPVVNFNAAPNQLEINTKNAAIVFGSDRPAGLTTGYGARGAQGANTIDVVVGRMAGARRGRGPADGALVEPSFGADSARIYISQKTDIDLNFGLADGNIGSVKGHSAIGLKADGIRIIGREGVKIVTGRSDAFRGFGSTGETNSIGGAMSPAPPIELIAGNSDGFTEVPLPLSGIGGEQVKYLQGVSRGENTRDAIKELGDLLEEVIGVLFNLALIQKSFNTAAGLTIPYANPTVGAAATMAGQAYATKVINSIWQTRINKIMWDVNHLEPYGYKYICSKNVFST
tara:strand:+ start:25237 stop:26241 length:1005 start_codon:yes stop_codon:yes gene_type:complete